MEALIFLIDAIAIIVVVITSLRNDKRKPGTPMFGPFAYSESVEPLRRQKRPADYLKREGS